MPVMRVKFFGSMLFVFYAAMILSTPSHKFSASVDKTTISPGESIRLTLEYDGQASSDPDLSKLRRSFSIISQQKSTSSTFINGSFQVKSSWVLDIYPKSNDENLIIPAISLGTSSSDPIQITQSDHGQPQANSDDGLGFSVKANKQEAYVHEQILLSIRIKSVKLLGNSSLNKLELDDAIIEPMKQDELSEVIENGIRYRLIERSFAIFPQKPGRLVIPAQVFRGQVLEPTKRNSFFGGFRNRVVQVVKSSSPIEIEVKSIPKSYPPGQPFLPLKSFTVIESFDQPEPRFEVNQATTRRFELKAQGALSSFLPRIAPPDIKNLKVYSEEGIKEKQINDDGILASNRFSHVYMPLAPGEIEIKAQTIYWWDTDKDRLRTTIIRPLKFEVLGAVGANLVAPPPAAVEEHEAVSKREAESDESSGYQKRWMMIMGIMLLSLTTIVVFILIFKRRGSRKKRLSRGQEFKILKKRLICACKDRDTKGAYRSYQALSRWAEENELLDLVCEPLKADIASLEKALYDAGFQGDIHETLRHIQKVLAEIKLHKKSVSGLAPLYPV